MHTTNADPNGTAGINFSWVVIALLKGVVYRENDEGLWQSLFNVAPRVREYVSHLGLELILDEAEGFAYLRQRTADNGDNELPRLVVRRPLSYPISLLLALLRRRLAESDAKGGDTRLIMSREDIVELLRMFLPATNNESKLFDKIDAHINRVVELGFLRRMKNDDARYEVRRILKSFVDAQWLNDFDARLEVYASQATTNQPGDKAGDQE